MENMGAIILAAGKGKRMKAVKRNKVTLTLANKPIITHIVDFMKVLGLGTIVVVVGHAKASVQAALVAYPIIYAEQRMRLGTGHAVTVALRVLPEAITDVLVVFGDDAVLYSEKQLPVVKKLLAQHKATEAAITFLTIEQDNPLGLGRIVRDTQGQVSSIVEEKDATDEEKKITEINPGCFLFKVDFLRKYLPKTHKSPVTGEYYLTQLIELAIAHNEKVETLQGGKLLWRGINTPQELEEAENLIRKHQSEYV